MKKKTEALKALGIDYQCQVDSDESKAKDVAVVADATQPTSMETS